MMLNILLATTERIEETESTGVKELLDNFNDSIWGSIADFIGIILTFWPILTFVVAMIIFILFFQKRLNKISKSLMDILSKNGKYIKGLFVELNDAKELTRYFSYGCKWKERIISDFNRLFDDENGRRLDEIFEGQDVKFRLSKIASIDEVYNVIDKTIILMGKLRKREVVVSDQYQKTAMLFYVYGYRYIEKLEKLKTRAEFIKNKYIVLTGSAGNGKTNLLCSVAELLIDSGKLCFFINAKDVETTLTDYMKQKLTVFDVKFFNIYWYIQNALCVLFNRTIYIVIDAINENDSSEFIESIPEFIDNMMKHRKIRVIVSCRSEYFDLKYKKILVDKVENVAFCYDIMSQEYSDIAKARMYDIYKVAFNYTGRVSLEVREKLYQQLLLMRMFFEVNRNSDMMINNLNKYEIFQKYIDVIMDSEQEECNIFLNAVVREMCNSKNYSAVKLSKLKEVIALTGTIKTFVDETILLSRKLITHENSIIEQHDEEIYFVFDEMRDYCVARYVLGTLCAENGNPEDGKVIGFIDDLIDSKCVSTEGVINYIYCYYKGLGNANMCKSLLFNYMQPHDRAMESNRMHREVGLNSWGLKVIFENNNELSDYEKQYVQFILEENPGRELTSIFAFLVHQEEIGGKHNLQLFLDLIFRIHDRSKFCEVLKGTVSSWWREGISQTEFIQIDMNLQRVNPDGGRRFRCYMFLFMEFLQWDGKAEILQYFRKACDVKKFRQEISGMISFEKEGEKDEFEVQ